MGTRTAFELPTRAAGTAFQRSVWELVAQIPYGRTTTYGEIARELGDASLAREVGAAVGSNPLSVIVPIGRRHIVHDDGQMLEPKIIAAAVRRIRCTRRLEPHQHLVQDDLVQDLEAGV